MSTHQRMMPLLGLLVRLRWQRDPDLWTVRCRDGHGRRARMRVHLSATGVSIAMPSPGPAQLTSWQAGQLRVALRDAALRFGELAGPEEGRTSFSYPAPATLPPPSPPARQRVQVLPATARPTVAQIARRLTMSSTPEPLMDPDRVIHPSRTHPLTPETRPPTVSWPYMTRFGS